MLDLRSRRAAVLAAAILTLLFAAPASASAKTCADYTTQAAAQQAGDTRDADGDGIYCESLPCPCSTAPPGSGGTPSTPPAPPPTEPPPDPPGKTPAPPRADPKPGDPATCTSPSGVQDISFSATKYPNIRAHFRAAVKKGWPETLVINRAGAGDRRARLLRGWPTKRGNDRDEYPPAVGRGLGKGLTKGSGPAGWKADVRYVPSRENRSHGSSLGAKLRRFCTGTKFRYAFY